MNEEPAARSVTQLTDPRALRALAHPTRLSLVGLLRRDGPMTATQAGQRLGESSASASFHLRQLAKYGLVEEAGGGTGRERPWRATAQFTAWPEAAQDPDVSAAADQLAAVIAARFYAELMRWLENRHRETPQWQQAVPFGDTPIYVTPAELTELARAERALVDQYAERNDHPELRPSGARRITWLHLAFPGDILGDDGGQTAGGGQ